MRLVLLSYSADFATIVIPRFKRWKLRPFSSKVVPIFFRDRRRENRFARIRPEPEIKRVLVERNDDLLSRHLSGRVRKILEIVDPEPFRAGLELQRLELVNDLLIHDDLLSRKMRENGTGCRKASSRFEAQRRAYMNAQGRVGLCWREVHLGPHEDNSVPRFQQPGSAECVVILSKRPPNVNAPLEKNLAVAAGAICMALARSAHAA